MKIKVSTSEFNNSLIRLKEKYKLFAPVSIPYKGTYSDTDVVRYKEIDNIEEIELSKKSNFSPKGKCFTNIRNIILFYGR